MAEKSITGKSDTQPGTMKISPTLKDVALAAKVSTATVSRYINMPDRVQPATRARIEEAVRALGYTPHYGAQMLASRRTNTVGAVIPTIENAIFARGLQAFQEQLARAGVTMLVASSGYDTQQEAEQIRTLVGRGADGLLLIGRARAQETYDFLSQRKLPYVVAWNYRDDDDNIYVGFDNFAAMQELARLVLSYGHQRIAMIAGHTANNDRAADRVAGVHTAIAAMQSPIPEVPVIEVDYTLEDGGRALQSLIKASAKPTAIICGNDVLAAGAILAAKQMGLVVPDDISIVGFDDIDLATVVEPNITTVHVPHRRMGAAAANLLLNLRDGQSDAHSIQLETHVVVRQSLKRLYG